MKVFTSYHAPDRKVVERIVGELILRGFEVWLDAWDLKPGDPWADQVEHAIRDFDAALIAIGSKGVGPFQSLEIAAILARFARDRCPVVPILLPGCRPSRQLPLLLSGLQWVDFRRGGTPRPFDALVEAIR